MKILKYLTFLSILSGIFFIVYHQCDETGFRRWWTALKMATIIASILAGLDGFPLNNNLRKTHHIPRIRGKEIDVDLPRTIQGLENIFKAPRTFREVDTDLDARRGNHGDQCPASQFNMEKEHTMFMEDMSPKGIEVECD